LPWPISSGGEISNQILDGTDHRKYIRLQLGSRTLFALEHMMHLIYTVLGRKIGDLNFLGVLIIIRTAPSVFPSREIKETEKRKHAL
jgi:uncharacterized membrane protein